MSDMDLLKIEPVEMTPEHGVFHVEQLEPGFGVTLGNALRRVLLSQLPGAAIDTVRIDGVYHEFSEIPGVREDTTELILNLKQIRLRSTVEHPEPLRLEVTGPGRVSAADIKCPPEVEIINPELYLFTLDSADSRVTLELTVRKGKGYLPADRREGLPIGMIPVDAIFTPIRKVNFAVETIHRGVDNLERLVLDVETDGTIRPDEAVAEAASILVKHLAVFVELGGAVMPQLERHTTGSQIPESIYNISIDDLDLSPRVFNGLKRAGITKVGQILEKDEAELLAIRNFGQKSLEELKEHLAARGLLSQAAFARPSSSLDEVRGEAEEFEAPYGLADLDLPAESVAEESDLLAGIPVGGEVEDTELDPLAAGSFDNIPLDDELDEDIPAGPVRGRRPGERRRASGGRRGRYDEFDEEDF